MQFKRTEICRHCGVESDWTDLDCPSCGKYYYAGLVKQVQLNSIGYFHHEKYGIGVCALQNIQAGTLIESAPAYLQDVLGYAALTYGITFEASQGGNPIPGNHLWLPWFFDQAKALTMGYAMALNHSWEPNVIFCARIDKETGRYFMDFITSRDVRQNEELCIQYGEKVWFHPYTREAWEREERIRKKREALEAKERDALQSRK